MVDLPVLKKHPTTGKTRSQVIPKAQRKGPKRNWNVIFTGFRIIFELFSDPSRFDLENEKWQSLINMKETAFVSKICTSKTGSINEVVEVIDKHV